MRRFFPCLFILSFFLAGCGEKELEISCGDLEKRMAESSNSLQPDFLEAGRAKASGDTKTVCQTSASILSTYRPMFKAASTCKSISAAISLNKLIRTMEEMRQESRC